MGCPMSITSDLEVIGVKEFHRLPKLVRVFAETLSSTNSVDTL